MRTIIAIPKEKYLERLYQLQARRDELESDLRNLEFEWTALCDQCEKHGITTDGTHALVCTVRAIREVHIPSFKARFPDAYKELLSRKAIEIGKMLDEITVKRELEKIGVKEAEELVGRIPLHKVCSLKEIRTYKVASEGTGE